MVKRSGKIFSLLGTVVKTVVLLLFVFALNGQAWAGELKKVHFHIAAQALEQALLEYSRQSGLALLVPSPLKLTSSSSTSIALNREMEPLAALSLLLKDTGLIFKEVEGQGLVILPEPVVGATLPEPAHASEPVYLKPLLEEVIVTASKRQTNLQDTAMAITALNHMALSNYEVSNLFDLDYLVPNLQLARNGDHSASVLYIRGIGSDNYTEAGDPGIATHVDGIYSSRSQGSAVLLYDLEQIEILRGPQGTLFGRNSTGGVINYHSKKPVESFESSFDITLGDYQRRAYKGMINVPVNDSWAVRLAGATDRADGFVEFAPGSVSQNASERYNNLDLSAFRLSSLWHINERADWWLSYEEFRDQGAGFLPISDYDTPLLIDTLGRVNLSMRSYRSRFNWQINQGLELSYIAGFSHMTRSQDWDGDGNSALGSETDPAQYHQSNRTVWSKHSSRQHEFQLKNPDDSRLRWLLAYFHFEEDNGIRFDLEHQDALGSGWGGAPAHSFQQPSRGSKFEAVYGQLSFDLNEQWRVAAGARTGRDVRFDRGGRNIACPDLIRSQRGGELGEIAVNRESALDGQCFVAHYNDVEQEWSSTTYMTRLEYRPADDLLFYLLFAEGFKPGIVEDGNAIEGIYSGPGDPAFVAALAETIALNNSADEQARAFVEPELSKNVELGFKLGLLDGAMTLNGALFNTRYTDLQVSGVAIESDGSEIFRSTNAAAASIKGLEVELNWAVSRAGFLSGNFALLDAHYDRFLAIDRDFPRYGQSWNPSANNPGVPDLVDYSGNQLKQAPELSLTLAYHHVFSLPNGSLLTPQLRFTYSDKVYFDEANRGARSGQLLNNRTGQWEPDPNGSASRIDFQPSFGLWDASLKYEPASGGWSLVASVTNLGDELVKSDAHTPEAASPLFYTAPPRTLSLGLSAQFQ